MDHSSAVIGSGGDQRTVTREEFLRRLGQLAEKWQAQRGADLEIRHETGKLLNDHFGPPTAKQQRGEGVLKEVVERLQVAESELSRMRRFAFHFKSAQDLKEKHPEATTWTAVKGLLPRLKPQGAQRKGGSGNGAASPAKQKQARPVQFGRVKQSLEALTSKVRKARNGLTDAEKEVLLAQFKELAEAISDCLHIPVSVGQVSEEPAPPAAPKE
jgi:hypothetical protein